MCLHDTILVSCPCLLSFRDHGSKCLDSDVMSSLFFLVYPVLSITVLPKHPTLWWVYFHLQGGVRL